MTAASLTRTDATAAFAALMPGGKTAISWLGPAFFTKYLYFATGTKQEPLCLILDARVANSLVGAGWDSMHARGGWPSATYGRYLELITRWRGELSPGIAGKRPRADLIERWLFDHG